MRIPMGLKIDNNGLLYIDSDKFKRYPLNLNKGIKVSNLFYSLMSTDEYIIKCSLYYLKKDLLI